MAILEPVQLDDLCDSVISFTAGAIHAAIEQARDPEKGNQLLSRLTEMLANLPRGKQSFAVAALCLILGEAHTEAAIPNLLKLASDPDFENTTGAVALYSLQRMGEPAWRAAMKQASEAVMPAERVLAYDVLDSAEEARESIHKEICDFCISRIEIESKIPWAKDDWNPRDAVVYSLLLLHDGRAEAILRDLF